jgi:phage I-like protein
MLIDPLNISNGALAAALSPEERDAGDKLPKRLKLLNWGNNETQKGVFPLSVDPAAFESFQRRNALERVAIDFEHNTVPGSEMYLASEEPRKVAGYGRPVVLRGDGLYLEDIVWTPEGIKHALNYEDISAAPVRDKEGGVIGLHSAGLTRAGATYGLTFFSANQPGASASHNKENRHMDEDTQKAIAELPKLVQTLSADLKTLQEEVSKKPASADGDQPDALKSDLDKLRGTVEGLTARQLQAERQAIVDRASAEGKVIPLSAERIKETSPEFLSAMVEALPAGQVPTSRKGGDLKDHTTEALNASLSEVARKSGYTVEQLRAGSLTPPEKKETE